MSHSNVFLQTSERYKGRNITNKRKLWWVPVLYNNPFNNMDVFTNYWMCRKRFGITCVVPSPLTMKCEVGGDFSVWRTEGEDQGEEQGVLLLSCSAE